jgi:demethylmenaquinone methyltransferase/2-methoxy-6-polyprenyl-1,4-benzoquinol methylase
MPKPEFDIPKTHFGFESIPETQKRGRVSAVFSSVSKNYDLMNDLMSAGLHRLWKKKAVDLLDLYPQQTVLDIAAGTGDLTIAMAKKVRLGTNHPSVWHTDINRSMLLEGKKRLINSGFILPSLECDAEQLPFPDHTFDRVMLAFGLRNMTHKDKALAEIFRVLKPRGRVVILEFSHIQECLKKPYDWYSFQILPKLGSFFANDADSYRYLAESIRMHPDQETLKNMFENVGFQKVSYLNLNAGLVAIHTGVKP